MKQTFCLQEGGLLEIIRDGNLLELLPYFAVINLIQLFKTVLSCSRQQVAQDMSRKSLCLLKFEEVTSVLLMARTCKLGPDDNKATSNLTPI